MTEIRVGGRRLARIYEVVDGRPRTVGVEHDGVREQVSGDEVALVVDGRAVGDNDLVADGGPQVDRDGGGLRWRLTCPDRELALTVVVSADRDGGVVRKHFEITGRGRLEWVQIDGWQGPSTAASAAAPPGPAGPGLRGFTGVAPTGRPNAGAPGLGQPIFGRGWFAGVEHPGAANVVNDGTGSCGLPVARDLGGPASPGPYVTPGAVVGAAPAARELDGFWDHLDRIRARPPRVVALVNNWYQLGWPGRMDHRTVAAELAGFTGLAADHGLRLDAYCLDDAWEGRWVAATGLWGRLDPSRFPGGLAALQRAAGLVGVGLWVSPFGGYGGRAQERVRWGAGRGYEIDPGVDEQGNANGWGERLCPSGPIYGAHLGTALGDWTQAGVRYWKLDGVQFDCQGTAHGHATGPGSGTDQMDRFAALLDGIGASGDAAVAFTSGSNPSPWWLRHADFLWRGGVDDTAVELAGPRLARFATYIDDCLHEYRGTALPVSALVTFSVVENEAVSYREGGSAHPIDDWRRHCWWMVGRGTLHHDLYCAPGSLTGGEWAAVAEALEWARRHQHVLARSRMVGGVPMAGDVYGFASRRGREVVLSLRNPAPAAQTTRFTLAELAGVAPDGGRVAVTTVWSDAGPVPGSLAADQPVELRLPPFGVVVLTAAPSGSSGPGGASGP